MLYTNQYSLRIIRVRSFVEWVWLHRRLLTQAAASYGTRKP